MTICSYQDLNVYQNTYLAMKRVMQELIPRLPAEERNDLADQMRRASKSIPRLIAEGYAKRHQRQGFQKYLYDALAETNEMIVNISQCKDLYGHLMDANECLLLLDLYDKSARQLYKLANVWSKLKEESH